MPCCAMPQARARLRATGGGFKQWTRRKAQQDGAVATAATCPSLGVLCRGCHAVLGAGSHCGKASLGAVWACEVTHILVASCGGTHWSHPLPWGKSAVGAEPGTPLPGCPVGTLTPPRSLPANVPQQLHSDQTPVCPLSPPSPLSPCIPSRLTPAGKFTKLYQKTTKSHRGVGSDRQKGGKYKQHRTGGGVCLPRGEAEQHCTAGGLMGTATPLPMLHPSTGTAAIKAR